MPAEVMDDGTITWVVLVVVAGLLATLAYLSHTESRRANVIRSLVARARKSRDREAGALVDQLKDCEEKLHNSVRHLKYALAVARYDLEMTIERLKLQYDETYAKLEQRVAQVSEESRLRIVA